MSGKFNNLPTYKGKSTVYLDQNILDMFVKYGLSEFGEMLASEYQVIYSDETLKEIKRSVGFESNFLDILNKLNAFHLKVCLDKDFKVTGDATITDRNSYQAFQEYNSIDPIYSQINDANLLNLRKIYGGIGDLSFEDIKNGQLAAYDQLHTSLEKNIEDLKPIFPQFAEQLENQAKDLRKQLELSVESAAKAASENVNNPLGWSGIKEYRDYLNIGPIQLNNIEPPNVLVKIWDICRERSPERMVSTIEKFYATESNPIDPNEEYFNFQKVASIYNMLNMLGYYPDSQVHRDRRFIAAMNDQGHASLATFADILISSDKNFLMKTQAAYEFLGINTRILLITNTKNQVN